MGQKTDPRAIRLKITDTWKSRWFARGKEFAKTLKEDETIRKLILKKFSKAGILRVDIERFAQETKIIVHSTRPGMIIGKAGLVSRSSRTRFQKRLKTRKI